MTILSGRRELCTERIREISDDLTLFVEAVATHAEDVGTTGAAEAVLGHLEDALPVGLGVLLLVDVDGATDVDGMEDAVLALEFAILVDLADEDDDAVGGLRPVGQHLGAAHRGDRVGRLAPLAVVEGLQGVLEDEDLLAGVGLAEGVRMGEELRDERVLADVEAFAEVEALRHHLHLVEGLLTGVVEADVPRLGDGVGQLQEHRRLAGAGGAGEHHDGGGHEAVATEGVVEPGDADLLAVAELLRDLDVVDVGATLEALDADVEVHLRHVRESFRGLVPPWVRRLWRAAMRYGLNITWRHATLHKFLIESVFQLHPHCNITEVLKYPQEVKKFEAGAKFEAEGV